MSRVSSKSGGENPHFGAGVRLLEQGKVADALESFKRALQDYPEDLNALANLAYALNELRRPEEALAACNQALALNPDARVALVNRAVALGSLARHSEALECIDRALAIDAADANLLRNRGTTLFHLRRFEESVASFAQALAIRPELATANSDCGLALMKLGRYHEALNCYGRAIAAQPDNSEAIWNDTLCRLLLGQLDFPAERMAWLWQKGFWGRKARGVGIPVWTGTQALHGKSILLHEDQGLGDAIQFARYVPRLVQMGAIVYLGLPKPLLPLLETIAGCTVQILEIGGPYPPLDFQCPLSSLPFAFGMSAAGFAPDVPYLSVDHNSATGWRRQLAGGRREKLVGVCWRGNPEYKDDAARSIPLDLFSTLFAAAPGIRFVSLQRELTGAESRLAAAIPQLIHPAADFANTAQIIAGLDLVISVDSVWAHCAGGFGKPFWVLLPIPPHWVWFTERNDSPWYPTARLFRQERVGDWQPVLARAAAELSRWQTIA
jgi:tetratricopeptide (TPR) repeat protein